MTFKTALEIDCGIKYMFDLLDIKSSSGRKMLLESNLMLNKTEITQYYSRLQEFYNIEYEKFTDELYCVKDIFTTINKLKEGFILDDIELFEIKNLAMISERVCKLLKKFNLKTITLSNLNNIINILDPDKTCVPSFYIYDSYSDKLKQIRKQIKDILGEDGIVPDNLIEKYTNLMALNDKEEALVRKNLSERLREDVDKIKNVLINLSLIDILIAKNKQIKELKLSFPKVLENGNTIYDGMFNPFVEDNLNKDGKIFQKINICISDIPITIIGANMGGKSVILKTLALNQLLMQFGFGVAAEKCTISIVENVILCSDTLQSVMKGVSSFAAEILAINNIIKESRNGVKLLALIDEPARTTNPVEGTALVEGLLDVVNNVSGNFIITTHYNINNKKVKRFRVKGLRNNVMDYSLIEVNNGEIPQEAVAIAESLGVDNEWINNTKKRIIKETLN